MSPNASTANPQTTRPSPNPCGSPSGNPQAQPPSSLSAAGEPSVAVASKPSFPEPLAAPAPVLGLVLVLVLVAGVPAVDDAALEVPVALELAATVPLLVASSPVVAEPSVDACP